MRRPSASLRLALLASLSGCGGSDGDGPAPRDGSAAAGPAARDDDGEAGEAGDAAPQDELAAELDRLRGLGYADASEEVGEPDEEVVPVYDRERTYPGYNLLGSKLHGAIYLVDCEGNLVHQWRHEGESWTTANLLPDGDLLLPGFGMRGPDKDRGFACVARLRWDGKKRWRSWAPFHHDVDITPDGRLASLTTRPRRIPQVHPEYRVRDEGVALLSPTGEILEEHSIHDMLAASPDLFRFQEVKAKSAPEREGIDLLHCNAVELMHREHLFDRDPLYAAGNVLVTSRHQDVVVVFDLEAGKAIWVWGRGELSGPHDGHVLENGNLLIFDNGLVRKWSRVIELDPLAREIVWEWRAPEPTDFFTAGRGGAQRLPNGNTLIADSDSGVAFEVTREGEVVWKFRHFDRDEDGRRSTFARVHRVPAELVERMLAKHGPQQR